MREISVYIPGRSFPSVSVTGSSCSMSCAHCSGRYLRGMVDVSQPRSLYDFGIDLWKRNGEGMLVSGGCDPFGAVDFPDHTFSEIKELKEQTGLQINLHCGLVDDRTADMISGSSVDKVSFDFVFDDDTIMEVLRLDAQKDDYLKTVTRLMERDIDVVPHILAGLNKGSISWEHQAVEELSKLEPDETVLIILIPTKGTEFENVTGPDPNDIVKLARHMRDGLSGRVILGCMRPKGQEEIEKQVLDVGFDGIVLPNRSTIEWIKEKKWTVNTYNKCCCMD